MDISKELVRIAKQINAEWFEHIGPAYGYDREPGEMPPQRTNRPHKIPGEEIYEPEERETSPRRHDENWKFMMSVGNRITGSWRLTHGFTFKTPFRATHKEVEREFQKAYRKKFNEDLPQKTSYEWGGPDSIECEIYFKEDYRPDRESKTRLLGTLVFDF